MKLEQNDMPLLFSNTNIPDVFFTEYLSQTNGDYIKVYLFMAFFSKYNKDIKVNDLAKKLALPFNTIQDAIKYWEDLGVITKKNTGFVVNNLQEIALHKLYKPKVALSSADIAKNEQNQNRAKAIDSINNSFFQGTMSSYWFADIDLWFKKYSFDEQVMIALFRYCYEKSALHRNYVQVVADAWFKNGIKTYSDLDYYFEKQETLNKMKKQVAKKLGITRALTQYEDAYIEKWIVDFGYDFNVIEIALKRTTSKANPTFDYIDKLISDWHDRGLKTADDVNNFLIEYKQKQKSIKELEKKTNYNNHSQRKYDNLDSLYANNNSSDNT